LTDLRKEELWKRKQSCREFGKESFTIPKSSDVGRSLENVLGKFLTVWIRMLNHNCNLISYRYLFPLALILQLFFS